MKLSARFVLDNLFVIAAGFLAVATMTWSIGVAHWVAFAVSVAVLVLAGLSAVLVPTLARKAGHGVATTENVVHQLEVLDGAAAEKRIAA